MAAAKAGFPALEAAVDAAREALDRELGKVPNEVHPSVPVSNDEAHNAVLRTWGACAPPRRWYLERPATLCSVARSAGIGLSRVPLIVRA
jgi:seryl-tRNA synthetase